MDQKQLYALLMLIGGEVIELLIERKKISYDKAANTFYSSGLYAALENEGTKLWRFSTETLYALLDEELTTGKITFPEEQ